MSIEENDAVAGIVAAVMIVALVISVISIVQTVYVPNWMEEREYEHMEKVAAEFSRLSFAFDVLAETEQDIPITASITLGSKELGFLMSSRAYGSISILEDGCFLLTEDTLGSQNLYPLLSLKYSSENAYYLDQSLIYESGAMIISQVEGDVMAGQPSFTTNPVDTNISFDVIQMEPLGERLTLGGYGTYPIRTEYINSYNETVIDLENFTIETNYPYVWHNFLNTSLSIRFDYGTDYTIISADKTVMVDFSGTVNVDLKLKVITIGVEIGLGLV